MTRKKSLEKQLKKVRSQLEEVLRNYPDGKITDLIGAQVVYKLLNKAVVLARKAGYADEEIRIMLLSTKPEAETKPASATAPPSGGVTFVVSPSAPGDSNI